jgi:hypothetical protein
MEELAQHLFLVEALFSVISHREDGETAQNEVSYPPSCRRCVELLYA